MTVTLAPDLTGLSDEQLAGMFGGADDALITDLLAELDRRDAEEQAARRRQARRDAPLRAEWESAAHAQYLEAERACNGVLLRRDSPLADPWDLWRGPWHVARAHASEELRNFWDANPRITITEFQRQLRDDLEVYADGLDADGPAGLRHERAGGPDGHVPDARPDGNTRPARPSGGPMTTFADVTPLAAEWLWDGFVPLGELTLLAGRCGTGKSFTTVDLAARVSRGQDMPDGTAGIPAASVIMINAEDDASTGVVHRLAAAGADLARIHDLSEIDGHPFDVVTDMPALRAAVAAIGDVGLVVIDPLSAASSVSLASALKARNTVVRPLMAVARDTGAAVIAVHHLVKSGSVAGSQAVVDTTRHLLTVEPSKSGPAKVITVAKSNLAPTGATARYELAGEWPSIRVSWLPPEDDRQTVSLSAADAVILALDTADGPMTSRQLAAATGCNYGAARTACTRLAAAGKIGSADGMFYPVTQETAGQAVTLRAV